MESKIKLRKANNHRKRLEHWYLQREIDDVELDKLDAEKKLKSVQSARDLSNFIITNSSHE
jgi:hypothetical protein